MSRLELARLLMIVTALLVGMVVAFLVILHRERRKRAHWSTRTRAAHPHWSIVLAGRIERAMGRLTLRRRHHRHHRRDL